MLSMRVLDFSLASNEELMTEQLDLLEERQEMATIRLVDYRQKMARRYDKKVRSREFSAGHLVLHRATGSTKDLNAGKLAPNWEGLYQVTTIVRGGAYYLENLNKRPLPRPWNVQNLKIYYY